MEYIEVTAKTLSEAITAACEQLTVPSDRLDYIVVTEGSTGFLGMGSKPAIIKARIKEESAEAPAKTEAPAAAKAEAPVKTAEKPADKTEAAQKTEPKAEKPSVPVDGAKAQADAKKFLTDVFHSMNMPVVIETSFDEAETILNVDLSGEDMGVLIGKRGQTLDSLQYLVSLVVNRDAADYIHVKVDTEDYRARRKATLENLAKNISYKVKRTHRPVSLEPMNPYERRIIHSALQGDRYVTTHSEGEEPYRRVVVTPKRGY